MVVEHFTSASLLFPSKRCAHLTLNKTRENVLSPPGVQFLQRVTDGMNIHLNGRSDLKQGHFVRSAYSTTTSKVSHVSSL